jgi:hypothetical protein
MFQDLFRDNKFWWATAISTLGDICRKTGRAREAESYYGQVLDIYEGQPTKNHQLIAATKIRLSDFLLEQNRTAEAERVAIQARDEARQYLGGQNPLTKTATDKLAAIYEKRGKPAAAESIK